jgi:hypothetical protein
MSPGCGGRARSACRVFSTRLGRWPADVDRIWALTQDVLLHPRWDLRFSSITPTGTDVPFTVENYPYLDPFGGRR